jgi:hypothetical protein
MTPRKIHRSDARASSSYGEAHRFADSLFPRDLWDLGQADLERITETFRGLAPRVGAALRLNPSSKHPHPGRALVKRVGNAEVRVELTLAGPSRSFEGREYLTSPDRPDEFRYVLAVFRTPRQGFLHRLFPLLRRPRRDPTEWQEIAVYTPEEVREAGAALRETLERTARSCFPVSAG